jgi:DNA-binding MarR family transcriptional regulator
MRMPVDAILARILAGLHDAGFTDLVPAHLNVLRYPGPDNRRPSDLAAEARMSKQAMNYLLGQLEQLDYLIREHDPDDQRSKRVQLTARGEQARRTIRRTVTDIETELARALGPDQVDHLRQLLTAVNNTDLVRAFFERRDTTTPG